MKIMTSVKEPTPNEFEKIERPLLQYIDEVMQVGHWVETSYGVEKRPYSSSSL